METGCRANRRIKQLQCHLTVLPNREQRPEALSVSSPSPRLHVHIHRLGIADKYSSFVPKCIAQLGDRDVKITHGPTPPSPATYHILVSGVATEDMLDASPNLSHVIMPWAGILPPMREVMSKKQYRHLQLHKLPFNAISTAETATALLLAAARNVVRIDRNFRKNDWSDRYDIHSVGITLAGKSALILGYGAIGEVIGRHLLGLGIEVRAIKRNPKNVKNPNPKVSVFGPESLHDLLPQTNILMISAPGTPDTTDLIGQKEIDLLPKGSIIVNVGRGPIINQKALYEGLKSRKLGAAGIDVWWNYPTVGISTGSKKANEPVPNTKQEYPFNELDNITISPHRAGGSDKFRESQMLLIAKYINDFYDGVQWSSPIDVDAGY